MNGKADIIGEAGLKFFGKMSASISHEIINVLAIINENAGLLEDFTFLIDQGKPVDSERLKKLAQTVMKQVRRADLILKKMNQFAHSIDDPAKQVDLNEILELMTALADRLAAMRSVRLDNRPTQNPVMLKTAPFHLLNLLWLTLDFAMGVAGDDKTVELEPAATSTGTRVSFRRLGDLNPPASTDFPTGLEKALLARVGAEMTVNLAKKEIVLDFSGDVGA